MSIPCHTPSTFSNCASDERGYWKIRVRQDTAANWLKNDPCLASGEFGYVLGKTDGPNLKIGDGWLKWSQLPWVDGGGGAGGHTGAHIVSDVEPPPADNIGDLWIYPDENLTVTPNQPFSNSNPPQYIDPPVSTQVDGTPIGLSPDGQTYHEPVFVGGVPVMVNGKRYLMPLVDPDISELPKAKGELFTYVDPPITQQSNGTHIGLDPDGLTYTTPEFVGGIYVMVGGKRYILPLIEN